ncbi:MAG: hypothetical protein KDE15_13240 [Erythrobacter sp.]|nr:hypothetical protein [Erythrobacter sp.]
MNRHYRKAGITATIVALAAMAAPLQAQFGSFGGIVNDARRASENNRQQQQQQTPQTQDECQANGSSNAGRQILGGILGRTANDAAYRAGISSYVPMSEFSDQLSTAIACRLDPQEQRQAAEATVTATRGTTEEGGANVGTTTTWVSETRPDVSGRSTVTGREPASADGMDCIMVSDVIIVSGEETRADKRMCRRPPSPRYSITA